MDYGMHKIYNCRNKSWLQKNTKSKVLNSLWLKKFLQLLHFEMCQIIKKKHSYHVAFVWLTFCANVVGMLFTYLIFFPFNSKSVIYFQITILCKNKYIRLKLHLVSMSWLCVLGEAPAEPCDPE